ncbi:hypothetical protein [Azospirillum sp. TSO5]|uniref:hypothetical protein n=1 Tax=Azospirillum sp. TSO5 TaxID=716760 RepID=UPI000D60C770|nr:hypothetical protein [Azospirillum sp. TSO5]PWC92914.1 hypothetical protein TSO5_15920 [Azospirillum sp. TSO5]
MKVFGSPDGAEGRFARALLLGLAFAAAGTLLGVFGVPLLVHAAHGLGAIAGTLGGLGTAAAAVIAMIAVRAAVSALGRLR